MEKDKGGVRCGRPLSLGHFAGVKVQKFPRKEAPVPLTAEP